MDEKDDPNTPALLTEPFMIGAWRADPAANTLQRDGETTRVEPKVMDLLALLATTPDQVVSRETLDAALWPDVTVGEDTLARTLSKLRRALGDAAAAPAYIETVPKRGYRVIAPVTSAATATLQSKSTSSPDTPSKQHSTPHLPIVIGGVLVAIVAAVFLLIRSAPDASTSVASPAAAATERAHDLYMKFTRADNEAAIALYERAIAADPNYAAAQAGLANALVQRVVRWQSAPGDAPSAETLTEAIDRGLTQSANAIEPLKRAIDLGERAVRLSPGDADALKALGFAYSAAGELEKAKSVYERALALDENAWEAAINLGELANIAGEREQALAHFEQAFTIMDRLYADEPQRVGPWRAPLGVSIAGYYEERDDFAGAEAWYRRVLDQSPLEPEATTRLARLLRQRGAETEAEALCDALNARVGDYADCGVSQPQNAAR